MGKASAQRSSPHPTEAAPTLTQATKIIRAPALRVDTQNSLYNPIKEAILHSQAGLGIQVVTPSSPSIQHGAPPMEEVMAVMEVMVVMAVMEVMVVMAVMAVMVVILVDTSTKTQTTKS